MVLHCNEVLPAYNCKFWDEIETTYQSCCSRKAGVSKINPEYVLISIMIRGIHEIEKKPQWKVKVI